MIRKIIVFALALFILANTASAIDSSDWNETTVGYESFKIPPKYSQNPYSRDFNMYEYDYDIDEFTIRYVNPRIMDLYGYFLERNEAKKVNVAGHDAIHFTEYDRHDGKNNSKLWFSAGEEFYYIAWRGEKITPTIKEVVKSCSKSKYSHDEFYSILNDEYNNYKIVNSIESQRFDYPTSDSGHHSFVSVGSNGVNFGVMT